MNVGVDGPRPMLVLAATLQVYVVKGRRSVVTTDVAGVVSSKDVPSSATMNTV